MLNILFKLCSFYLFFINKNVNIPCNLLEMFKFNFTIENAQVAERVVSETTLYKKLKTDHEATEYGILSFEEIEQAKSAISNNYEADRNIIFKKIDLLAATQTTDSDEVPEEVACIDYVDSYKIKIDCGDDSGGGLAEINKTHDLVAGKYEGGLKVWELSIDLARFIYNASLAGDALNAAGLDDEVVRDVTELQELFKKKRAEAEVRVVELGCGHALPSLSLLRCLGLFVVFVGAEGFFF